MRRPDFYTSNKGIKVCKPYMKKGDFYVAGSRDLDRMASRGQTLYVVGDKPSWLRAAPHLADLIRVVMLDEVEDG